MSLVDASVKRQMSFGNIRDTGYIKGILVKISTEGNVEWTKLINVDYSPVRGTTSSTYKTITPQGFYFYGAAEDNEGNLYIAEITEKT